MRERFGHARWRFSRYVVLWSIVLTAAAATVVSAAPAATAAPAAVASGAQCQILLGKATAPASVSPVLSSQCAKAGEQLVAPASSTLLMVWYDRYNYGGASTKIYGAAGPCDSSGYGIAWVGATWNDRIRSYRVFNYCYYSAAFQHINWGGYCREYYSQVPDASAMDVAISSFWISRGNYAWQVC
jgi:hypothetical protein